MSLAIEEASRVGEKPVSEAVVRSPLARDIDGSDAALTRQGYDQKVLSSLLNIRQSENRSFLHGDLPPGRTKELREELLTVGIPL